MENTYLFAGDLAGEIGEELDPCLVSIFKLESELS